MKFGRRLCRDDKGAAAIEMAFALPAFVLMTWMLLQLAQVYRAVAGIQHALGQGARFATLCVNPTGAGCDAPTAAQIQTRVNESVYGIGPGTFDVPLPVAGTAGTSAFFDVTVDYTQPTNLLLLPGPTITVTRSKRVWVAAT